MCSVHVSASAETTLLEEIEVIIPFTALFYLKVYI